MDKISIGCDIEENKRFADKTMENNRHFLEKIFTQNELEYCYKKSNYAQHLCARFCAKEATIKALCSIGITDTTYKQIEITNNDNGCPNVNIVKHEELNAQISLSHCKNYSMATVIIYQD